MVPTVSFVPLALSVSGLALFVLRSVPDFVVPSEQVPRLATLTASLIVSTTRSPLSGLPATPSTLFVIATAVAWIRFRTNVLLVPVRAAGVLTLAVMVSAALYGPVIVTVWAIVPSTNAPVVVG